MGWRRGGKKIFKAERERSKKIMKMHGNYTLLFVAETSIVGAHVMKSEAAEGNRAKSARVFI